MRRGSGGVIPTGINSAGRASSPRPIRAPVTPEHLLPHLDAAYNLARWMMGNNADAEDVVQEACVRAIAAIDRFRGGDPKAWLLTIVRNGCYSTFRQRRGHAETDLSATSATMESPTLSPERQALGDEQAKQVQTAIAALAPEFREVIVLREFEGLAYKEIAAILEVPMGTVMSRLSRARAQLQGALAEYQRSAT